MGPPQSKLDVKSKELEKLEKLSSLPPLEQQLADKFSAWEAGEPTHDKAGLLLEGKVREAPWEGCNITSRHVCQQPFIMNS